jgi:hypothetical protein
VAKAKRERDFLLIHHEKLFILEKGAAPKYSTKPPFIELKI